MAWPDGRGKYTTDCFISKGRLTFELSFILTYVTNQEVCLFDTHQLIP